MRVRATWFAIGAVSALGMPAAVVLGAAHYFAKHGRCWP